VTIANAIERIQFAYPQVYHACHTRHVRRRSSPFHLSARDSQILAHLDRARPMTLSLLARHLDVSPSTLSEAVSKLAAHGYLLKAARSGQDRRRVGIVLTSKGVQAVRSSSVLDAGRLRAILQRLTAKDIALAVRGLSRLAEACRPSGAR
jgi:DNA-binding MarR family transcriptional regulator